MPTSEARKKANRKWDAENMATIACRLKKEQAEKFKRLAESKGTTANQMIKEYVLAQIAEEEQK